MAIGLFFQSRSIVFTDKLISKLTQSELLAIAAHEIAHHKYWHIPFLVITLLCSMVWSTKLFELFDLELSEAYMYAMNIAIMLLTLILVSRRFESQADSYAVVNLSTAQGSDVVTEDSVKVMTNALEIACNNQKKNSNSHDPLHGSIKSRQLTLQKLVGRRISDISINKQVKWFKVTIVIALIAGIVV